MLYFLHSTSVLSFFYVVLTLSMWNTHRFENPIYAAACSLLYANMALSWPVFLYWVPASSARSPGSPVRTLGMHGSAREQPPSSWCLLWKVMTTPATEDKEDYSGKHMRKTWLLWWVYRVHIKMKICVKRKSAFFIHIFLTETFCPKLLDPRIPFLKFLAQSHKPSLMPGIWISNA